MNDGDLERVLKALCQICDNTKRTNFMVTWMFTTFNIVWFICIICAIKNLICLIWG
jgi:hypothetical protein